MKNGYDVYPAAEIFIDESCGHMDAAPAVSGRHPFLL